MTPRLAIVSAGLWLRSTIQVRFPVQNRMTAPKKKSLVNTKDTFNIYY